MKKTFNTSGTEPLSLLRNTVGYVPATEKNPEIWYIDDKFSEHIAAITLLTCHLIRPEFLAQFKLRGTPLICAFKPSKDSLNIRDNIFLNYPVTTTRESNSFAKKHEHAIGTNAFSGASIEIYQTTKASQKKSLHQFAHLLLSRLEELKNEPDDTGTTDPTKDKPKDLPLLKTAGETLKQIQENSEKRKWLTLQEIFDVLDDPKELLNLARKIEEESSSLNPGFMDIPRLLGHEIGHNFNIGKLMEICNKKMDIYELNQKNLNAPEVILMQSPEYWKRKFFRSYILEREMNSALESSIKDYDYYLNDEDEAMAELTACAVVNDINVRTGLNLKTKGLDKILPESYAHFAGSLSDMHFPTANERKRCNPHHGANEERHVGLPEKFLDFLNM
ncbi:MAG: hypothetical protein WBK77_07295 [Alphaproteobacteria bacterium]